MTTQSGKTYTVLMSADRAAIVAALFIGAGVPFSSSPRAEMPKHSAVAVTVDETRTEALKEAAKLATERQERQDRQRRTSERETARAWLVGREGEA